MEIKFLVDGKELNNITDYMVEQMHKMLTNYERLRDFQESQRCGVIRSFAHWCESKSQPLDWSDPKQAKYYAAYDYAIAQVVIQHTYTKKCAGTIYASNKSILLKYIDDVGINAFIHYALGERDYDA